MIFEESFDFCLINNPYNKSGRGIVFVTARGLDYLDETIIHTEEYKTLKVLMEHSNFIEIEFCSFEAIYDISHVENDLIEMLEGRGLRYSKSLEIKINREIDEINKSRPTTNLFFPSTQTSITPQNNPFLPSRTDELQLPQIGEKISLYFYLFLECHFVSETDCILMLNTDFQNKKNNHYRNFLGIVKSEFIVIPSNNFNSIALQSTKKYKDFLNESSMLHQGKFKLFLPYNDSLGRELFKTREFQYNLMEIRKNINPENYININIGNPTQFNVMLKRSAEIKKELTAIKRKTIQVSSIKDSIQQIKKQLEHKMVGLASVDEFEKASVFKKNISLLDSKLNIIDSLEKDSIPNKDYLKIFSLN